MFYVAHRLPYAEIWLDFRILPEIATGEAALLSTYHWLLQAAQRFGGETWNKTEMIHS